MFMIAMVDATNMSLSAILFRPDVTITADMIWPDKAAFDVVREAHLLNHSADDYDGLICVFVPDHIEQRYLPKKSSMVAL